MHSANWQGGNSPFVIYEPPPDKTYEMACESSEDSDQPGHPPSLMRVFAVRLKKAWVFSCPLSAQADLSLRCAHRSVCWFCPEAAHICLNWDINFQIKSQSDTEIKGTHTTPVKHYVDDLTFTLSPQGSGCNVKV